EDLLAGLVAVQRLQLRPLLRLRLADEPEDDLGEDCPLAVEAVAVHRHVAVGKEMGFDDHFEGAFVRLGHSRAPKTNRARSRRSISNGVMHLMPRPMHASGILILSVDAEGTSCVTTVCWPASA